MRISRHSAPWVLIWGLIVTGPIGAQPRLPVIDMHLHVQGAASQGEPPLGICFGPSQQLTHDPAESWPARMQADQAAPDCTDPIYSPETDDALLERTLLELETYNVIGMLSGPQELVQAWSDAAPERFIPGFQFRIGRETDSADEIGEAYRDGRFRVFAEITNQYIGIAPDDSRFKPYLDVAEREDIPVGIHVGIGPPGAPYFGFADFRASLHSPLTLEDALIAHPRLRVYAMHAGWPMVDDLLAVLWNHPQLYVDTGGIVFALPRAEFYRFLQRIVDAGFGQRVMFGTDQMVWPELIGRSIDRIEGAPFLSQDQKRDILYNNAARFLRLSDAEIRAHHAMGAN